MIEDTPITNKMLDEIDARLAEIGEHIFNMEVDSKKLEKKYFVDKEYGPVGSYLTFKEDRRYSDRRCCS